ncbi:MAG: peptidoglycan-binding domain-containing protein [Dermatophilaceae bacterium]
MWWHRDLAEGEKADADVRTVRTKLGLVAEGDYDHETTVRVRGLQRKHNMEVTGVVDKKTAAKVGERADAGLVPEWYTRELREGDAGFDVECLARALKRYGGTYVDSTILDDIRKLQAANGLTPTGVVDRETAVLIRSRT